MLIQQRLDQKRAGSVEISIFTFYFTLTQEKKEYLNYPLCDRHTDRYILHIEAFCTPDVKCINTKASHLENYFRLRTEEQVLTTY